jgi:hypothetical protein
LLLKQVNIIKIGVIYICFFFSFLSCNYFFLPYLNITSSFSCMKMVCLGPRKKEKKSNVLSPDDVTSRGLKKSPTSKLKNSKTNSSLAPPSIASNTTKKTAPRPSLDAGHKTGLPRPTSRNSLVPNNGRAPSPVRRPGSRPVARPVSRPTSPPSKPSRPSSITSPPSKPSRPSSITSPPSKPSRPSSIVSVKSNHTTASVASTRPTTRNSSQVSSAAASITKRSPITMKEEFKGLKAQVKKTFFFVYM